MNSRLVVLGSCGAWPEANRPCSGFVVEHAGVGVVLDLGYGTLPRLLVLLHSSVADGIDAVIVTHGDSHYAGLAARYAFERWTGISTDALEALEFSRYAIDSATSNALVIAVSNSGRVARTVECGQVH